MIWIISGTQDGREIGAILADREIKPRRGGGGVLGRGGAGMVRY